MLTLTFEEAVVLVDEIVASKPEGYKYTEDPKTADRRESMDGIGNGCYYANNDGSAGCIVGQVIHKLNPEFDLTSIETFSVYSALSTAGIQADYKASEFLTVCQGQQDNGMTWAFSANMAKNVV